MAFIPPVPGEIRGPWESSPGNPQKYQAAVYTERGWVYFFAKTSEGAIKAASDYAKTLKVTQP